MKPVQARQLVRARLLFIAEAVRRLPYPDRPPMAYCPFQLSHFVSLSAYWRCDCLSIGLVIRSAFCHAAGSDNFLPGAIIGPMWTGTQTLNEARCGRRTLQWSLGPGSSGPSRPELGDPHCPEERQSSLKVTGPAGFARRTDDRQECQIVHSCRASSWLLQNTTAEPAFRPIE